MVQNKILVAGAGHIGSTIAHLLGNSKRYDVVVGDLSHDQIDKRILANSNISTEKFDVTDGKTAKQIINQHGITAIMNCLPYFLNKYVADIAASNNLHYFDLTEDVESRNYVKNLSKPLKSAFVSHCGLAPGFINIVAEDLIKAFDSTEEVKLRCGALPQSSSNALQYALTWSTDGLINEYLNPCSQLVNGEVVTAAGLSDLEDIQIDGSNYEAFNTSGGVATLLESHEKKIQTLNYKTIRYPGHCDKMRFLARGLKLDQDRDTLIRIINKALPKTDEDVVIVYVAVVGRINNTNTRKAFVHKYYPREFFGVECTAIKATTASSACAVIDAVLSNPQRFSGFVRQEDFKLEEILDNEFGNYLNY